MIIYNARPLSARFLRQTNKSREISFSTNNRRHNTQVVNYLREVAITSFSTFLSSIRTDMGYYDALRVPLKMRLTRDVSSVTLEIHLPSTTIFL